MTSFYMVIIRSKNKSRLIEDQLHKGNYSQGTESFRTWPGSRMTNTLRQTNQENIRHPASSYKFDGY